MQASARLACTDLGFTNGFFQFAEADTRAAAAQLPPPWIGVAFCGEDDMELTDCSRATFGDTASCGVTVELFCSNAAASAFHDTTSVLFVFDLQKIGPLCGRSQLNNFNSVLSVLSMSSYSTVETTCPTGAIVLHLASSAVECKACIPADMGLVDACSGQRYAEVLHGAQCGVRVVRYAMQGRWTARRGWWAAAPTPAECGSTAASSSVIVVSL